MANFFFLLLSLFVCFFLCVSHVLVHCVVVCQNWILFSKKIAEITPKKKLWNWHRTSLNIVNYVRTHYTWMYIILMAQNTSYKMQCYSWVWKTRSFHLTNFSVSKKWTHMRASRRRVLQNSNEKKTHTDNNYIKRKTIYLICVHLSFWWQWNQMLLSKDKKSIKTWREKKKCLKAVNSKF